MATVMERLGNIPHCDKGCVCQRQSGCDYSQGKNIEGVSISEFKKMALWVFRVQVEHSGRTPAWQVWGSGFAPPYGKKGIWRKEMWERLCPWGWNKRRWHKGRPKILAKTEWDSNFILGLWSFPSDRESGFIKVPGINDWGQVSLGETFGSCTKKCSQGTVAGA